MNFIGADRNVSKSSVIPAGAISGGFLIAMAWRSRHIMRIASDSSARLEFVSRPSWAVVILMFVNLDNVSK